MGKRRVPFRIGVWAPRGVWMFSKKALLIVLSCLVVLSVSPLGYGQSNGSFSGTVTDKTGSVIAGATVKVTSQGTGLSREAKTDDTGH